MLNIIHTAYTKPKTKRQSIDALLNKQMSLSTTSHITVQQGETWSSAVQAGLNKAWDA